MKFRVSLTVVLATITAGGWGLMAPADKAETTAEIARLLGLEPGSSVADVGAGNGEWTSYLVSQVGPGGRVYATEVDKDDLKDIERRIKREKLSNVEARLGTNVDTGLDEECCDAILLRHVYHHFDEPEAMRLSLLRSLKPGGSIAIVDFSPDKNLSNNNVPSFRKGHGVEGEEIVQAMKESGFSFLKRIDRWEDRSRRFLLLFQKPEVVAPDS